MYIGFRRVSYAMIRHILVLITYVMILMQPFTIAQSSIILSYNVYYDNVKIAYMEVHVASNNVLVKIVPLVTLDPSDIELLKKLITIPSKIRFYLVDKDILSYLNRLGVRDINKSIINNKLVLWYRIDGFEREVEYCNGILAKEESILGRHRLIIELIAVITNDYVGKALVYMLPVALFILIMALHAYVKREYIRIL